MKPRHLLSWKALFYDALLPGLRRLGPERADAALVRLGHLLAAWPPRRKQFAEGLARARAALDADWDLDAARGDLAAGFARFLARDYPLDGLNDAEALARFDVEGEHHLWDALGSGRGALILGTHLGAFLSGMHWLDRRCVPHRLLIQRTRHVSSILQRRFDQADGPHPQPGLFLRRGLPAGAAAGLLLRARSVLRDGLGLFLMGDVPWSSTGARPGRLLGRVQPYQAAWLDLARWAKAPVVPMFCRHLPVGRFAITFDPPFLPALGSEEAAVSSFLARLESEIAAHPSDAVAHLLWPTYNPPSDLPLGAPTTRRSRRRREPAARD